MGSLKLSKPHPPESYRFNARPAPLGRDPSQPAANKQALRQWLRNLPKISENSQKTIVATLVAHLLAALSPPSLIGLYAALPDEIDLCRAITTLQQHRRMCALPVVRGQTLQFVALPAKLAIGYANITEPQGSPVQLADMAAVVVPGLAFDTRGVRLGRGGGFYDRFLQGFSGLVVGVAPQQHILQKLPKQSHDCQMHWVITERTLYRHF